MSFVNSIATTKGGRHVDHVADLIVKNIIEKIKKTNKTGMQIKPFQVYHLFYYLTYFFHILFVRLLSSLFLI
jgi:DNA topoisomerase-2